MDRVVLLDFSGNSFLSSCGSCLLPDFITGCATPVQLRESRGDTCTASSPADF